MTRLLELPLQPVLLPARQQRRAETTPTLQGGTAREQGGGHHLVPRFSRNSRQDPRLQWQHRDSRRIHELLRNRHRRSTELQVQAKISLRQQLTTQHSGNLMRVICRKSWITQIPCSIIFKADTMIWKLLLKKRWTDWPKKRQMCKNRCST